MQLELFNANKYKTKNITNKIRTQEVSNAASVSSQFKPVREKLLLLQTVNLIEMKVLSQQFLI